MSDRIFLRGQAVPTRSLNQKPHLSGQFWFSTPKVRPDPLFGRAELGQPIFENDAAKQVLMETILAVAHRFAWQLHAYAIMTNHFHLVVTTPRGNLSEGMHALQSAFANKHKAFRGSVGHVFQSRFGCAHYPAGQN